MSPPPSTAASFSTLRERSALHLLVMGAVCLIAVAYDFAESLFGTWIESQSFVAPTLVAFAVFLGGAILIKKVAKTPGVVNAIAIAAMIAGAKCLASISKLTPPEMRPELTLVLIFAIILMSRAAIVPERPRITLILGGLFYLPLLHITYDIHKDFTLPSPLTSPSAPEIVVYVGFLWTVILFTALASSQAIYGLRRRASKAEQLGQYTLEERLGGGGMGHVYRAQHALLQRPTAVKLIRFNDAVEREALISRFEQEVNNSAQLTHPNTITVYDYGRTDEGVFYYAMELLEGASLEEVVTIGGAMPVPRVLNTMRQSAAALSEAHALGLIHRDIKPGNIMLAKIGGRHDFVKVLDFGLVKDVAKTQDVSITQAGALVGTPHYMAPEASSGEELQATADVYALGAVAYFLLTGKPVFSGNTPVEILGHHLHTTPAPLSETAAQPVPEHLEALIMRCLAKAPEERPRDASELAQELSRIRVAPGWLDRDAAEWWEEYGPAMGALRSETTPPQTASVTMIQRAKSA